MKTALIILAFVAIVAFVVIAFRKLWRWRRPASANNWQNEHHLALQDDGTWAENSESLTHRDTSPPRIF